MFLRLHRRPLYIYFIDDDRGEITNGKIAMLEAFSAEKWREIRISSSWNVEIWFV